MPKTSHYATLSLLGLMLLLGACGQSATPPTSATAQPNPSGLVRLNLAVKTPQATGLHSQGVPTADNGSVPNGTFAVTVRDSNGKVMIFNGGEYDPTGKGSPTLILDSSNASGSGTSVVLPIGTYSFETTDKAASGEDVLLAYGPAAENTQVVDATHTTVTLKLHAVLDPAQSVLDKAAPGPVGIHDLLNLRLFGKTSLVNGTAYNVPSSDLILDSYSLGAPEQGTLNGAGSAQGVSVVTGDLPEGSSLNVAAKFQAWIRTAGTDVATLQPQTLNFSTPISRANADVHASIEMVNVMANTPTTLYGTATASDDVTGGIAIVRVYDAGILIGSNDPAEQSDTVSAITFTKDSYGHDTGEWSMPWTPTTDGTHDLSVRVVTEDGKVTYAIPTSGYASDFTNGLTNKWSTSRIITAPSGQKFLGGFQYNDQTSLKLGRLPEHTKVTVSFDLYMINTMDGNNATDSADGLGERWMLGVEGGPLLLDTNFTNFGEFTQAYPGTRGDEISHPAQTGASEVNSLGYGLDSVYHITRTFDHTGSDLQLNFAGQGYQDYNDENWGLNNVQVTVE